MKKSTLNAALARSTFRHRARERRRSARYSARAAFARATDRLPPAPVVVDDTNEFAADRVAEEQAPAATPHPAAVSPGLSVTRAVPISSPPPRYPGSALKRGIEGTVVVRFTIDARGVVRDASIEQSSPTGVFDLAALDAIESARYRPRTEAGVPVVTPEARKRFVFDAQSALRGRARPALASGRSPLARADAR